MASDELEDLLTEALPDLKFRPREDFAIFCEDSFGYIKSRRFGDRQDEDGSLQAVRFQDGRDHDVGIDNQPQWDHPRLDFPTRAALITWFICREVSLSVPLRFNSSTIIRKT